MLVTYGELTDDIAYKRDELIWSYLDTVQGDNDESKLWDKLQPHQRETILAQATSIARMLYES